MAIHFEITGKHIKDIVKAIENINEECVWTFDSSGLLVRMSDVYKYKMLQIHFTKEDFISYNCDNPEDFGIIVERIKDVSKTLRTKDTLIMTYEDGEDYISISSAGLTKKIKLIDTKLIGRVPHLNVDFDYSVAVPSRPILSFLKSCGKAISFNCITTSGGLMMICENDEGESSVKWSKDDVNLNPSSYESDTNYAVSEVMLATSTMSNTVKVQGSDDGVISFTWGVAENSTATAMVAHRE